MSLIFKLREKSVNMSEILIDGLVTEIDYDNCTENLTKFSAFDRISKKNLNCISKNILYIDNSVASPLYHNTYELKDYHNVIYTILNQIIQIKKKSDLDKFNDLFNRLYKLLVTTPYKNQPCVYLTRLAIKIKTNKIDAIDEKFLKIFKEYLIDVKIRINISDDKLWDVLEKFLKESKSKTSSSFLEFLEYRRLDETKYLAIFEYLKYVENRNINDKISKEHFKEYLNFYYVNYSKNLSNIFLNHWIKNEKLRGLYLLGITNSDISRLQQYLKLTIKIEYNIFNQCIDNPYLLYPLYYEEDEHKNFNKCDKIDKYKKFIKIKYHLRINISDVYIKYGKILIFLYINLITEKWTSTPKNEVIDAYSNFHQLKLQYNHLEECFKIHMEYNSCYLSYVYNIERKLVRNLEFIINYNDRHLPDLLSKCDLSSTLDEYQRDAVFGALLNNMCMITGGPGTGKTTIIKEIINNLQDYKLRCIITSFTGKAVSRIKKSIDQDKYQYQKIATIDSILQSNIGFTPVYVIIDEMSMVSTLHLYKLLKKFNNRVRVVMLGDINQLPPIPWGDVFTQLYKSNKIPIFELKHNNRKNNN